MIVAIVAVLAMLLAGLRPRGTREWMWAALGAAMLLIAGREPIVAAARAVAEQWNVLLFILGLMVLSAAAEESGAFALVAEYAVQRAGGSQRRLFVLLFLAGAALTMLLSNDATAIVFTPIVYRAVASRGADALAFLFGCTFVADTASFGLPFANPANVIILPRPDIIQYLIHLGPPELFAVAINLALFVALFHRRLRGRYDVGVAPRPEPAAVRTLVVACCIVAGYLAALAFDVPLGPVALLGGLAALGAARVRPSVAAKHVSWSTFVLLAALFVLLDALDRAGFTASALHALDAVTRYGTLASTAAAAVGAALLANVVNNLPVAVASAHMTAQAPHLAYPLIAGTDLGPNLTTTGSLATILWMAALRKRGVCVSPLEYLRLGAIVVPPMLAVTILWLWLAR
ncbi:MAG: ArsB/NhaD family transporter [Candidatus Tyrphobacter sp.]